MLEFFRDERKREREREAGKRGTQGEKERRQGMIGRASGTGKRGKEAEEKYSAIV